MLAAIPVVHSVNSVARLVAARTESHALGLAS